MTFSSTVLSFALSLLLQNRGNWTDLPGGNVRYWPKPESVERLINIESLTMPEPGVECKQFASTDRSGKGRDHGNYLRTDGKRHVLAEMDGPGVIVRIWSANAQGTLRIYIDGEAAPRIDCPFQDIFTNKYAPFVEPIAIHAGGGWISYFPIAYQRNCRVEVEDLKEPGSLYYQIQYQTYPKLTAMRSFERELPPEEKAALAKVLELWKKPGNRPTARRVKDKSLSFERHLEAGEGKVIFESAACASILSLQIKTMPATPEILRALEIEAAFDGKVTISAPLADFFGVGFGEKNYESMLSGWSAEGGYFYLPMPFLESANIKIINHSPAAAGVKGTINYRPVDDIPMQQWALHAEFRSVDQVGDELYEFANISGSGKFVGIQQSLQGAGDLWYLEGNEIIYINGEAKPSIVGTGTEDFYNGGWYWDTGTLALPLHGLGVKEEWTTNRTTPFRYFVPDVIPFENGFVGKIEHGSVNQVKDAYYSSVAYWYGPPQNVKKPKPEEFTIPRLWVKRSPNGISAALLDWKSEKGKIRRVDWKEIDPKYRASKYALFQQFPISYFIKNADAAIFSEQCVEFSGTRADSFEATFNVKEGDEYKLIFQFANKRFDSPVYISIDSQLSRVEYGRRGLAKAEGALAAVDGPRQGLQAGNHTIRLELTANAKDQETATVALDSIELVPVQKFINHWWISPPVDADPKGGIEFAPAHEKIFTSAE
ncbi:MAG: glycoside hydrolase family 172 protein, partial [Planctomycetota bacterium]